MKLLLGLLILVSTSVMAETPNLDVKTDVFGNSVEVIAINKNTFEVTCSYAVSWRLDLLNYRRFFGKITLRPDEAFAKSFQDEAWGQISHVKAVFDCQK